MTKFGKAGVVLCVLLGISRLSFARSPASGAPQTPSAGSGSDASPRVTVRVYNYALARALLIRSEGEATTILKHAGLQVAWVDCPLTAAEVANCPECQVQPEMTDFVLRIVTAEQAEKLAGHGEAMGEALDCLAEEVGCSAYVFYRDVQELARAGDASQYQLLGHAMAHELGHLLLGRNAHSRTGIMRAEWNPREISTIARTYLLFTDEQAQRIRDEISARRTILQDQSARARKN